MTTSHASADGPGTGEVRERTRARRWAAFSWTLFGVGFLTAAVFTFATDGGRGPIAAGVAIALCIAYCIATALQFGLLARLSDELEVGNYVWAGAGGSLAYVVVYPCWYVLWRGGLLPEPSHVALFIGFYATFLATYFWKKFV